MISTPSPSNSNRFSILPVYNVTGIDELVETVQAVQPLESPPTARTSRPRWERHLPPKLVIASLEEKDESRSLDIKVSIETTDTGEVKSLDALVDSGATGRFIDRDYVKANRLTTRTLSCPIPVRNVDGTLQTGPLVTSLRQSISS